jgi:hypothetical protein
MVEHVLSKHEALSLKKKKALLKWRKEALDKTKQMSRV